MRTLAVVLCYTACVSGADFVSVAHAQSCETRLDCGSVADASKRRQCNAELLIIQQQCQGRMDSINAEREGLARPACLLNRLGGGAAEVLSYRGGKKVRQIVKLSYPLPKCR